eukprot:scaffold19485_cov22-Tisochrysis_lutea.AAC.1
MHTVAVQVVSPVAAGRAHGSLPVHWYHQEACMIVNKGRLLAAYPVLYLIAALHARHIISSLPGMHFIRGGQLRPSKT